MGFELPRPDPKVAPPRRYGDLYPAELGDTEISEECAEQGTIQPAPPAGPTDTPHYNGLTPPLGYQLTYGTSRRKGPVYAGIAVCLVVGVLIVSIALMPSLGLSNILVDGWGNQKHSPDNTARLSAVTLQSPLDASEVIGSNVTVTWALAPSAASYQLLVADNPSFWFPDNITCLTNSHTLTHSKNGEAYYWKVRAVNGTEYGPWSPAWSYAIILGVDTPAPTSPMDGQVLVNQTPCLQWASVDKADRYRVQIALDSNFTALVLDVQVQSNTYQPAIKLSENTTYYWRAMAGHGPLNSTWGPSRSFFEAPTVFHFRHNWTFPMDGSSWTVDLDIPAEDYYSAKAEPRVWGFTAFEYAEYVKPGDPLVQNLSAALSAFASSKVYDRYQTAEFVLCFVASLPHAEDFETTGQNNYPRYPVETLVDLTGDCEDGAALFASLIQSPSFGYDAVLVGLVNGRDAHMAVGLDVQPLIPGISKGWSYSGRTYWYCETMGLNGAWLPIGLPTSLSGWSYTIVPC